MTLKHNNAQSRQKESSVENNLPDEASVGGEGGDWLEPRESN